MDIDIALVYEHAIINAAGCIMCACPKRRRSQKNDMRYTSALATSIKRNNSRLNKDVERTIVKRIVKRWTVVLDI